MLQALSRSPLPTDVTTPREEPAALARGAATITIATAVSRITGFVRVLVVAAAMGTTFLANTYQTANTAPNLIFELVAAGVLTSIFVPTFVQYLTTGRRAEGWGAANAMTSVALVGLTGVALLLAVSAPGVMWLLTLGVDDPELRRAEIELGTKFLWLFSPQIIFYGLGMIMTSALHAHRRFGMPAVAPIFNNVIVIAVYLVYAAMRTGEPTVEGITSAEIWVLGAGTTAGVIAMTLCLVPQLRSLGWRFSFHPDRNHPAVKRAVRVGAWALSYAGGYQAGLVVVMLLANKIEGGVAAYQWAYTFFYLPHALFGVPIFHVLFPEMSEHAARGEIGDVGGRTRDGLRMLVFMLVPVAGFLLVAAAPLLRVTLDNGAMTVEGTELVARTLAAFAVGLPTYSIFLVLTRSFYAMSDARTPALMNALTVAIASGVGTIGFFMAPEGWEVPALALGHSVAYTVGAALLGRAARVRFGDEGLGRLRNSSVRSTAIGAAAAAVMAGVTVVLWDGGRGNGPAALAGAAVVGAVVYLGAMRILGAEELTSIGRLVRRRTA